jgi:8-oxo-dGTP pyrophosphatase MutT (NUDIX family)
MKDFAENLHNEIQKGLPGTDVQWQMASSDRYVRDFPRVPGDDARAAAILILLFPENESIHTVFMQRPDYDGVHGGQISFPGGKREPEDTDEIQTALREAHEETGIDPGHVEVIGTLTPLFIPVSNMVVAPVIGWAKAKPIFNYKPEEVLFLIDADLKRLMDPSIIKTKLFNVRGQSINIKYFDYDSNTIWGATAMMLHELLVIIRKGAFFPQE